MRKFTFLKATSALLILLLAFSGGIAQTADNINPNAEKDIALVKGFLEGLVSGNYEQSKAVAHANMMNYGSALEDSTTLEQTIESWKNNHQTFSDMSVTWGWQTSINVLEPPFKGTHVYLWGQFAGTQANSGTKVGARFQITALLRDGKIAAMVGYNDNLSMMLKIGYKLIPPEK